MSKFVKNESMGNENDRASAPEPNGVAEQGPRTLADASSGNSRSGQCHYTKPDGSQCETYALHGAFYCFFHSPDVAEERKAARIKGGKERSRKAAVLPSGTPDKVLKTAGDITALLADTINQVLRGDLDHRISNSVGVLAGYMLKAQQQDQVERRLEMLELTVKQKWANPNSAGEPAPDRDEFEFVKAQEGEA